ncbi:hypothetical protein L914_02806 [Phytophthora nicotianae]|uniref:Uncharacterized protein n=1 Tax=Phytophthora nicotianae TaxID=4792 RepID=W2NZ37_PHYNI|nr:hypothetical protein L914_02806 [Phytophthora nicotianae]
MPINGERRFASTYIESIGVASIWSENRLRKKQWNAVEPTFDPDMQVEELTAFTSSPHESYRYVISLKGEKVNIWLENRSSKKQW